MVYPKHSADNVTHFWWLTIVWNIMNILPTMYLTSDGSQLFGISWIFSSGNVFYLRGLAALLRNFNFRRDIGRSHRSAEKTEPKVKMKAFLIFFFQFTWKDPLCASRWGKKLREEESGKRSSFEFPHKGDGSTERNKGNASKNLWFISVLQRC